MPGLKMHIRLTLGLLFIFMLSTCFSSVRPHGEKSDYDQYIEWLKTLENPDNLTCDVIFREGKLLYMRVRGLNNASVSFKDFYFKNLIQLSFSENRLQRIKGMENLPALELFASIKTKMRSPPDLTRNYSLKTIILESCSLSGVLDFSFCPDSLEYLSVNSNRFKEIKTAPLNRLTYLNLNTNRFISLPDNFCDFPSLKRLEIDNYYHTVDLDLRCLNQLDTITLFGSDVDEAIVLRNDSTRLLITEQDFSKLN